MTQDSPPGGVDRLNPALGALASVLLVAILGVLFVGRGNDSVAQAGPVDAAVVTTSDTTTSAPTESEPGSTENSTPSTSEVPEPFVMPSVLEGRWQSPDGVTTAQFGPDGIEGLQTAVEIGDESFSVQLVEPGPLTAIPTTTQPIQTVVFATTESESVLTPPQPLLIEFLATEEGLRLIFEVGGTMVEEHLRPSS